jgi:predicted lipoprotein with Yx(FWY)xxD motif
MRVQLKWAAVGAALLAVVAVGMAAAATMSSSAGIVKAAHNSTFGSLLVTAGGMTLYHYTPDKNGAVKCVGACAKFWPPLVVSGSAKPKAGAGVSAAKLSTVKRPDGSTQVTYSGFPLYRYGADKKPGDVKGQGVEGSWFAVTSVGTLAKALKGVHAPAPPSTTTNGGYGGYGP